MAGQRSNQLNYVPTRQINEMRNLQFLCGIARIAYRASIALCRLKKRYYWRSRPKPRTNFTTGAATPCKITRLIAANITVYLAQTS